MHAGKPRPLGRTLALVLVCATHFSVCSGGLLSTAAAFAASLPEDQELRMSPASPEDFVCMSFTPAHEGKDAEPACGDDGTCFRAPTVAGHRSDVLLPAVPPLALGAPSVALADAGKSPEKAKADIDGFFHARYHVTTLAKRE